MTPRSFSHIAPGVRDFDRSLHFYRDLLGFQVAQEITELGGTEYEEGISERENRKYRVDGAGLNSPIRGFWAQPLTTTA